MQRLPLASGSLVTRSPIANRQRCINYYPERNQGDALVPLTLYQRPGLRVLAQGPAAPVRGVFRASNGQGYAVIGQGVYSVQSNWSLQLIGTLATVATTPVSMTDNGISAVLVDNSPLVYTWPLASNVFSQLVDPNGLFAGATRVDNMDGYILWNLPGTHQFGSTLNFTTTTDPTYEAGKTSYPDPIQTLIVQHRQLYLIGQVSTETWFDAGNAAFPFAQLPGADHEHGTGAPYSVAGADNQVYWLQQNRQGAGMVVRARGYEVKRISDHAVEYAIRQMRAAGTINDAIGYTYQIDGHGFYVLCFPTGDQTWVFDESTELWHQRCWTDANGQLHRDRTNCAAYLFDTNVVGDFANGTLYALDPNYYVDTVGGVNYPIKFIRGFPHIRYAEMNLGAPNLNRPIEWSGERMRFSAFTVDLQCGTGPLDSAGRPAQIILRWSIDRGVTFGQSVLQTAGAPGQYTTQPKWTALGMGRDVVFEIEHTIAGEAALQGAWVQVEKLAS